MKRLAQLSAMAAALAALSGCYTQFAVLQRHTHVAAAVAAPPCPDSLRDSCAQAQAGAQTQAPKDTTFIDNSNRVCYWSRDWWGNPVLRCYRSDYDQDWLAYYNEPWWYNGYADNGGYGYGRCPSSYYFDPYTGYCRYYNDYNNYYHPSHQTGGSGSGSGGSAPSQPPRRNLPSQPSSSAATPPAKSGEIHELPAYTPGGSGRYAPPPTVTPAPPAKKPENVPVSPGPDRAPQRSVLPTESAPPPAAQPMPPQDRQQTAPPPDDGSRANQPIEPQENSAPRRRSFQ